MKVFLVEVLGEVIVHPLQRNVFLEYHVIHQSVQKCVNMEKIKEFVSVEKRRYNYLEDDECGYYYNLNEFHNGGGKGIAQRQSFIERDMVGYTHLHPDYESSLWILPPS